MVGSSLWQIIFILLLATLGDDSESESIKRLESLENKTTYCEILWFCCLLLKSGKKKCILYTTIKKKQLQAGLDTWGNCLCKWPWAAALMKHNRNWSNMCERLERQMGICFKNRLSIEDDCKRKVLICSCLWRRCFFLFTPLLRFLNKSEETP